MQFDDFAAYEQIQDHFGGPGGQALPFLLDLRAKFGLELPVVGSW